MTEKKYGKDRVRHEAAKKAWRTRRRMAKPSPLMKKILVWLAGSPLARITLHYHGVSLYYVSLCCLNDDGSHSSTHGWPPRRITRTTFRAMEKRGWLESVRRRETGGTYGTLPDGTHGIVEASFDLDYRITAKGRKALAD